MERTQYAVQSDRPTIPPKLTPITGRVSRAKNGIPLHVCELCRPPKTFTRVEHLRRHELSHKTPEFFCTALGCSKAFHRLDLLTRHMQRHEQELLADPLSTPANSLPPYSTPGIGYAPILNRDRPISSSTGRMITPGLRETSITRRRTSTFPEDGLPDAIRYPRQRTSSNSTEWGLNSLPNPIPREVYRQDNYKFSPASFDTNYSSLGFQRDSPGSKRTNDSCDIATDSGYASLGSSRRKNQLRDTIRSTLQESSSAAVNAYDDDARTEYSDARSLHEARLEIYVSEFAEELAAVLPRSISADQLTSLSATLPDILKAFAIRFGQENNTHSQYRLMYLVHRYRNQISKAVVDTFAIEEQDAEEEAQKPTDVMPIQDKMLLWARKNHQHIEGPENPVVQPENTSRDRDEFDQALLDAEMDNDNDIFESFPEIQEYRQTLLNSPAYSWLLKSVIIEVELEIPTVSDGRGEIRRKILEFLDEPSRITQRHAPAAQCIVFQIPWIRNYLISQEYNIPIHEALPRAMVVVGIDAQSFVTTCGEYLGTLWPDIGPQMLGLCISLLKSPHDFRAQCTLFDKTFITGKVDHDGSTAEFYVFGNVYSLAEIGELVVWLSSALNNNSLGHGLVYRRPACHIEKCLPGQQLGNPKSPAHGRIASSFLNFTFAESPWERTGHPDSPGCCWLRLFGNRPVVRGYPIPRRSVKRTGAEISLDLMVQLINARKVSNFSGYILIKACSAVLIPTQRSNDTIFWHLVFDQLGGYISYVDPRIKELLQESLKGLTRASLETSRHVVGWCTNVLNHAGTAKANYKIGWSALRPPGPGLAFEKISIVGGMFVTAGVSTIIGKRDKAVHFKYRDDYTMRLKWISKKFVVLYDVPERRAWLLDGVSALLHLVRASLQHDLNDHDPFKSLLLYKESSLSESLNTHGGKNAAISVLTNPRNLDIPLYAKPDANKVEVTTHEGGGQTKALSSTKTNYCLRDRIEDICNTLEQILAHQADTSTQDGVGFKVKASDRRHIEGFDFMDIATDEDPCWPRQATLRSSGRGWVDFVRAIHAITLFGSHFGDLIRPSKTHTPECKSCHANMDLPKGQDLLAVCVPELQDILQKRGSRATTPWRLVDDIYWLTPDKTFEPCQCTEVSTAKCDRVQVLLPATFPKLWGRNFKSPSDLAKAPRGALIFGHSRRFPLRWGDRGDPEQGHADQDHELDTLKSSMQDSGIGTSLDSSSGNDVNSPPSTSPSPPVQERTGTPTHALEGATESEPTSKRRRFSSLLSNLGR
ncbi:hypothetical protein F5Y10DRAFT_103811 [Nemania abortiva]|nr:hypothetical protein F5Y10DRAFT_103811 [Nemania abortiva]